MAKEVAHGATRPGKRYDLPAILFDCRNWVGASAQKDRALLGYILRVIYGPDRDMPAPFQNCPRFPNRLAIISLGEIEKYSGIQRETAVRHLEGLQQRGFIRLAVEHPGTRQAVYRATLTREVERWPVKVLHYWADAGGRGLPF